MFNVVVVGDSGVGKSSMIKRLAQDHYENDQVPTIGMDFNTKILPVGDKKVKLVIWDSAGRPDHRTITRAYYRGSHAVIICYDCTD